MKFPIHYYYVNTTVHALFRFHIELIYLFMGWRRHVYKKVCAEEAKLRYVQVYKNHINLLYISLFEIWFLTLNNII